MTASARENKESAYLPHIEILNENKVWRRKQQSSQALLKKITRKNTKTNCVEGH